MVAPAEDGRKRMKILDSGSRSIGAVTIGDWTNGCFHNCFNHRAADVREAGTIGYPAPEQRMERSTPLYIWAY